MHIRKVTEVSDELVAAMGRLIPQLNPDAPPPDLAHIERIVDSTSSALFIAVDEVDGLSRIIGSLTLSSYPIPTGIRVWIEDVVVDETVRGRGIGEALVRFALIEARELGASSVELTSRPSRAAANRLYLRLGFVPRDTTAYRLTFDDS